MRLLWFDFLVRITRSEAGRSRLVGILDGKLEFPDFTLDQDRRWRILKRLASQDETGKVLARIQAEERRDRTDSGERAAFAARVAVPQLERKKEYFELLAFDDTKDLDLIGSGMGSFFSAEYPDLTAAFLDRYFDAIQKINDERSQRFRSTFLDTMFPDECTAEVLAKSRSALAGATLHSDVERLWLEANDELERCVKARAFNHN